MVRSSEVLNLPITEVIIIVEFINLFIFISQNCYNFRHFVRQTHINPTVLNPQVSEAATMSEYIKADIIDPTNNDEVKVGCY